MQYVDPESSLAHIRHGIKTALASVLAYIIACALGLHFGYWGALSAVIVMQISVADSLHMCWYRLSGTVVGAIIAIGAIVAFPETTWGTIAALFTSVAFCAYMTRFNARYKMAAITTCIVVLASLGQEGRILFGLERVLEILIGVSCAFAVSVMIWPLRAGHALNERLRIHFESCADLYSQIVEAFINHQQNLDPTLLDSLAAEIGTNRPRLIKVMRHEKFLFQDDTHALSRKNETLRLCLRKMGAMLHSLNDTHGPGRELIMAPELRHIGNVTAEAMRAVGAGNPFDSARLQSAIDNAEARLADLRKQGVIDPLSTRDVLQFFSFFHTLRFTALDLLQLADVVNSTPAQE